MTTVPNQKVIKIHRTSHKDRNTFTTFDQYVQQIMMNELSTVGAVKLWLYLTRHQDSFEFALSSKDCIDNWGITASQYRTGFKELVDKGYLAEINGNHYAFYDLPQTAESSESSSDLEQISIDSSPHFAVLPPKRKRISDIFSNQMIC